MTFVHYFRHWGRARRIIRGRTRIGNVIRYTTPEAVERDFCLRSDDYRANLRDYLVFGGALLLGPEVPEVALLLH